MGACPGRCGASRPAHLPSASLSRWGRLWHRTGAAGRRRPRSRFWALQAKAFCSSAAREVGEISIQLLGGIGFTWEHLAHVRLRRILLSRQVLGDKAAQHAAIARTRLGSGGAAAGRR
jgi:alkylation response protein AidB-like acyl-CoA dehydrogenase